MSALVLSSTCLFSKWGFNDGDVPDALLDLCDERGIEYPSHDGWPGEQEWDQLLVDLVQRVLLPLLPVVVTTFRIGTIHNPIRAETVDGVPVEWDGGDAEHAHTFPEVTVSIPLEQVLTELTVMRL